VDSNALPPRSRLPESVGTFDSIKSEDQQELSRIFAVPQDRTTQPSTSGHSSKSRNTRRRLRSSTSRLQDVLKKRLSRDSVNSSRSAKQHSKNSLSDEDLQRRKELKRALHQRLKDELLRDRDASQGGYDTDAEVIITPKPSKSRSGGAIQISPKSLSDLVRKMELSQSTSSDYNYSTPPETAPGNRFHHDHEVDSSKVTSVWEDDILGSEALTDTAIESQQLHDSPYVTEVQIAHHSKDDSTTPSRKALDRSITVIHAPSPKHPSAGQFPRHDTRELENPASPDLLPLRMPSITDSVRSNWRLSLAGSSREGFLPGRACLGLDRPYGPSFQRVGRPTFPRDWYGEDNDLSDSVVYPRGFQSELMEDSVRDNGHLQQCDPDAEERDFGGVDGEDCRTERLDGKVSLKEKPPQQENSSLIEAPVRTAPKSVHTTISLPQLANSSRHNRSKSSGNYSINNSGIGRRGHHSSSSGYGIPTTNRLPVMTSDNASSVYTFQGESYTSSPGSSVVRLRENLERSKNCLDDLELLGVYMGKSFLDSNTAKLSLAPREEAHMRRRTMDTTSFESSTDSFRARELVAAARIVPKPRMVSRFKEELESDDIKSKSLGRKSVLGKGFGKRGNLRSYDGSEDWYSTGKRQGYGFSFVSDGEESAAGLWERALKEHAAEAAASNKRPGSLSQRFGSRSLGSKQGSHRGKIKMSISADSQPSLQTQHYSRLEKKIPGNVSQGTLASVIVTTAKDPVTPKRAIPQSWAKYPSYNRADRTLSPAGARDKVAHHDFATDAAENSPKSETSGSGKRKKSRSMTFGKGVLKSWSKLYKSYSSYDMKDQAREFRSSISYDKSSEYPELEVFGVGSPMDLTSPYLKVDKSLSDGLGKDDPIPNIVGHSPIGQRSARAWSKLYEDCVEYPLDLDAPIMKPSPAQLPTEDSTHKVTHTHQREPSSFSRADIRGSTNDFHHSLRIHESEARKSVLEAAEKAWAA
jgi:hypothetical protein